MALILEQGLSVPGPLLPLERCFRDSQDTQGTQSSGHLLISCEVFLYFSELLKCTAEDQHGSHARGDPAGREAIEGMIMASL